MSSIVKEYQSIRKKNNHFDCMLATGLYSATFLFPLLGLLAASAIIGADVGLLLLIGLIIGIAVSLSGYIWMRFY